MENYMLTQLEELLDDYTCNECGNSHMTCDCE